MSPHISFRRLFLLASVLVFVAAATIGGVRFWQSGRDANKQAQQLAQSELLARATQSASARNQISTTEARADSAVGDTASGGGDGDRNREGKRIQKLDASGTGPVAAGAATAAVVPVGPLVSVGAEIAPADLPRFPLAYGVATKAEEFSRAMPVALEATALATLSVGAEVQLGYFDGRLLAGKVGANRRDASGQIRISGRLASGGVFSLTAGPLGAAGNILPAGEAVVGVIKTLKGGGTFLLEKRRDAVLCVAYPQKPPALANASVGALPNPSQQTTNAGAASLAAARVVSAVQPIFNSRPDASAVIFLDFDGAVAENTEWNGGVTINAAPSGMTDAELEEAWRRVAEDYRAFNINVTTDEARYNAALVGHRMRCIITTTNEVDGAAGSGGIAYLGSWKLAAEGGASADIPCWVFIDGVGTGGKNVAEAAAHEVGHTLGLSHDGLKDAGGVTTEDYYQGRDLFSDEGWAPIMGVGYYVQVSQWSKGTYTDGDQFANNQEDDLAIISAVSNRTGYATDDAVAESFADAAALPLTSASTAVVQSVIETSADVDSYAITVGAGTATFTISQWLEDNVSGISDLDTQLQLYDATGALLETSNPQDSLFPSITRSLAAGTYFLKISAVGQGNGLEHGFTNYASFGRYRLSASFQPAATAPVLGGAATILFQRGVAASYQVQATSSPVAFVAYGLPDEFTLDRATGVLSATPTHPGSFSITIKAFNAFGAASKVFTLTVRDLDLGTAVGAPALTWTTGGAANWGPDLTTFYAGSASARNGVMDNLSTSWIETAVTGPGTLRFRWKVSSEDGYDFYSFDVDGAQRGAAISGERDWAQRMISITSGTHTLRWSYVKDNYLADGSDTAWLDDVSFTRTATAPVVTAVASGVTTLGNGYGLQIVASNMPTSYSATGLPAGLIINTSTGYIGGIPTSAGSYPITLNATNASGTGSASFTLVVRTRYTAWASGFGLSSADAANDADPDNDGLNNLLEYALGLDPTVANFGAAPVVRLADADGEQHLQIEFVRPIAHEELSYTVQVSSDLLSAWQNGHGFGAGEDNSGTLPTALIDRTQRSDGGETIVVRETFPSGTPLRFMRLRIATP